MGDLFGSYENTFGTMTAEITAKIGRIPSLEGGKNDVQFLFICDVSNFEIFWGWHIILTSVVWIYKNKV